MNKLTLLAITTKANYDSEDGWTGASIMATIEGETQECLFDRITLSRVCLRTDLTPNFLDDFRHRGYTDYMENFIMTRIRACLNSLLTKYPGTEKDINTIYEVLRLKIPRFISKSAEHTFYSQKMETGEITEYTEDRLDRMFEGRTKWLLQNGKENKDI